MTATTATCNCHGTVEGEGRSPAVLRSPYLGELEWTPGGELVFPHGLPGFENLQRMLPVEVPAHRPLLYLQSVDQPEVCFVTLPVLVIDPRFMVSLSEDDRLLLGLAEQTAPVIGIDILCVAVLIPSDGTMLANLSAPVIVNLHNLKAVQRVDTEDAQRTWRLCDSGQWERVC